MYVVCNCLAETFNCFHMAWANLQIPAPATTVDFDANQRRLIVCLQNGILCMWDIRDISRFVEKKISEGSSEDVYTPVEIEGAQPFINACFFQKQQLPMKNWLITAEKDGSVRIWDVSTDPWQEVWEVPESGVHSQDIGTIFLSSQSPDDLPETPESEDMLIAGPGVFASASTDGTINVFDGQHQRHMFQFKLDVSITCMDFFPDGYKLVVGDSTSTLQVLDTRSTAPVAIVSTDEVPLQVLVQHRINQTKMEDKREKMKSTTSDAIQRPGTIDDVSHRGKATQNSIEREENGHKNLSSHARTPPQPPIAVSSSEPGSQNSTVWPAPVSPIDHESSHLAERVSNLENSLADTVKQTISQTFETYMRTVDRKIESALERSADRQASSQGGSPSHPNSNQANDNISDQHLQQLIQKQVETAVSKSIEPISQKLQNMHLEILRQGHTMKVRHCFGMACILYTNFGALSCRHAERSFQPFAGIPGTIKINLR